MWACLTASTLQKVYEKMGIYVLVCFCWQLLQLSVLIYTPCLCWGNCGDRSTNTWGVGKDAVQRKKKKTLAFGKYRGTGSSVYSYQKLCSNLCCCCFTFGYGSLSVFLFSGMTYVGNNYHHIACKFLCHMAHPTHCLGDLFAEKVF